MSTKQKEARVKLRKKFQWYCNDARTHADEMAAQFNCDDPLHPYGPQEFTSPGHLPAHDHHPRHRHGDAMTEFDFAGITDALDQIVSVVTGFKQKMVDAGFSEEIAELAAMQLVQRLLARP